MVLVLHCFIKIIKMRITGQWICIWAVRFWGGLLEAWIECLTADSSFCCAVTILHGKKLLCCEMAIPWRNQPATTISHYIDSTISYIYSQRSWIFLALNLIVQYRSMNNTLEVGVNYIFWIYCCSETFFFNVYYCAASRIAPFSEVVKSKSRGKCTPSCAQVCLNPIIDSGRSEWHPGYPDSVNGFCNIPSNGCKPISTIDN